jgi:hypothetical protein
VVEGARLESVYAGNRIAGSNPAPSAISLKILCYFNALPDRPYRNPYIYPYIYQATLAVAGS